jgi:hypothetical protein
MERLHLVVSHRLEETGAMLARGHPRSLTPSGVVAEHWEDYCFRTILWALQVPPPCGLFQWPDIDVPVTEPV